MAANQFGVPIRKLYYCDVVAIDGHADSARGSPGAVGAAREFEKWQVYEASDIAPGSEVRMSRTITIPRRPADDVSPSRMRLLKPGDWLGTIGGIHSPNDAAGYLSPGCYIAICGRSPFVENALAGANDDGSVGIVFGTTRSIGDGR
jgi:hypothetical protein